MSSDLPTSNAGVTKCTHCGRENCVKMGDKECQEARMKLFEEMRERVARMFSSGSKPLPS